MKYRLFFITLLIIVFDQLSKRFIITFLNVGEKFLVLMHTTNTGAGFSILAGQNALLIWASTAIIGGLIYYATCAEEKFYLPIALILGGAIGNLLDRIIFGHVIDFIDLGFWPVFNIADSSITIGAAILVYIWFRK